MSINVEVMLLNVEVMSINVEVMPINVEVMPINVEDVNKCRGQVQGDLKYGCSFLGDPFPQLSHRPVVPSPSCLSPSCPAAQSASPSQRRPDVRFRLQSNSVCLLFRNPTVYYFYYSHFYSSLLKAEISL